MTTKHPIEYELHPRAIDKGIGWLALTLKNIGSEKLTGLSVRLNSLDVYSIDVLEAESYVPILSPEAEGTLPFQVSAKVTGSVYITLDGRRDDEPFHWETSPLTLTVGDEVAELVGLLALTEPYPPVGERIRCEAIVRGLVHSEDLNLEFWAETPSGEFKELAIVETKELSPGEEARYVAEIAAEEEGTYTIYAYLYDGVDRIGREVETVQVEES